MCGKHFSENDDVVACPQCGCPHHRDCWKQEGHCHFAADHGTERQWAVAEAQHAAKKEADRGAKDSALFCPHCGRQNPEFAEFCAHCGRELEREDWSTASAPPHAEHFGQYTPPFGGYTPPFTPPFNPTAVDPLGGISPDEEIGGFRAEQLAELVGSNAAYYLPRFQKMSRGGSKISWNWAAFLLPCNWLLYRKNLLWGGLSLAFWTILNLFGQVAVNQMPTNLISADQLLSYRWLVAILLVTSLVQLLICLLSGLFGNYLYMQNIFKKAEQLKHNPCPAFERDFRLAGGVSLALAALPYLVNMVFAYLSLFIGM